VAIESELGLPKITKDGVTVAKSVYFVRLNNFSSNGRRRWAPVWSRRRSATQTHMRATEPLRVPSLPMPSSSWRFISFGGFVMGEGEICSFLFLGKLVLLWMIFFFFTFILIITSIFRFATKFCVIIKIYSPKF
jgi:hypothetical protein